MPAPPSFEIDTKNLTAYRHVGVTAVKPNYNEAVQLLGLEALHATTLPERNARADQIATHWERLLDLTGAQIAAVTLDVEGAIVFERDRSASPEKIRPSYRTYARPANHERAAGAGDTFVSALTLALAAGAPTPVATDLAASAAAVVVGKDGTTACSAQELRQMLLMPSLQAPDKYVPDPSSLVARVHPSALLDTALSSRMAALTFSTPDTFPTSTALGSWETSLLLVLTRT